MTALTEETESAARRTALNWAASAALGVALLATVTPVVVRIVVPPPVPAVLAAQTQSQDQPLSEPLRVGDGGDWAVDLDTHGLDGTPQAWFLDDVVVAQGEGPSDRFPTLVGIDRENGEELWRFEDGFDDESTNTVDGMHLSLRTGMIDSAGEHLYLEYEKDIDGGQKEVGVVALSPRDGNVVWSLDLGTAPEYDLRVRIEDLHDDRLLVDVADDGDEQDRAVLIDVQRGEVVWEDDELLAARLVTPELVLGSGDDSIVAVDIADGSTQWEAESTSVPMATNGTRTLVKITGGLAIIDNKTGEIADRITAPDVHCLPAAATTVACEAGDGITGSYLLLIDLESDIPARPCYAANGTVTKVDDGRVFLAPLPSDAHGLMLDMECNVVSDDLPGAVLDIADDHVLAADVRQGPDSIREYQLRDS